LERPTSRQSAPASGILILLLRDVNWDTFKKEMHWMSLVEKNIEDLNSLANSTLEEAARQLHLVLVELASRLKPFPPFLQMASIQAVELEPVLRPWEDRGCVVVCPDGEIRRLELTAIPGVVGVSDLEQIEQFQELDLAPEEYIIYASAATIALIDELRRRGR
jgi:hypothetical protein